MADGDSFTEISTQSWGGRLIENIKGVAVGALLFLIAFPVLFWNEGRAVKTARALAEGRNSVVLVDGAHVLPANEGKLVHLTGEATTAETVACDLTHLSRNAVKLERRVEMFQWTEEEHSRSEKELGGGEKTVTTYDYRKSWSSTAHDSSRFKKTEGHINPAMTCESGTIKARKVKVGEFSLNPTLIGAINALDRVAVAPADLAKAPPEIRSKAKILSDGVLFVGADANKPQVGDYRISYTMAPSNMPVSIIARQVEHSLEEYRAKSGYSVQLLQMGTVSADSMFKQAEDQNKMLTWILRLVAFLLMALGLGLIFNPLATFANVIPIVGSFLRGGIGVFAVMVALPLSLLTIALAWLFYRPVLALALVALAVGVVFLARQVFSKKKSAAT